MLTTLTTVGYGDILPYSIYERLLIIFVFVNKLSVSYLNSYWVWHAMLISLKVLKL